MLIKFYKELIKLFAIEADKDGVLSLKGSGPLMVNKKKTVLPMKKYLRNVDEYQVFHPAAEDITMGPSLIIKLLTKTANIKYNYMFGDLMIELQQLASSITEQKKLNSKQLLMLAKIGPVGTKDIRVLAKIFSKVEEEKRVKYISFMTSSNNKLLDGDFHRVTIVSSPVLKLVRSAIEQQGKVDILGVPVTKKQLSILETTLTAILPGLDDHDQSYSRGASIDVSPYLKSLSLAISSVADALNPWLNTFAIDGLEPIDNSQIDKLFDNPKALTRAAMEVPPLPGNKGTKKKSDISNNIMENETEMNDWVKPPKGGVSIEGNVQKSEVRDDPPWEWGSEPAVNNQQPEPIQPHQYNTQPQPQQRSAPQPQPNNGVEYEDMSGLQNRGSNNANVPQQFRQPAGMLSRGQMQNQNPYMQPQMPPQNPYLPQQQMPPQNPYMPQQQNPYMTQQQMPPQNPYLPQQQAPAVNPYLQPGMVAPQNPYFDPYKR